MSEQLVVFDYKKRVEKEFSTTKEIAQWLKGCGYATTTTAIRSSIRAPENGMIGFVRGRFIVRTKGTPIGSIDRKTFLKIQDMSQSPFVLLDQRDQSVYKSDTCLEKIKNLIVKEGLMMSSIKTHLLQGKQKVGNHFFVKYYHDPLGWVKEAQVLD